MGSQGLHTGHDPQAEPVCPACGRPVGTAIRRHKVMGAWVPYWEARPCSNPRCALFGRKADGSIPTGAEVAEEGGESGESGGTGEPEVSTTTEPPEGSAPGGADAATTHVSGKNGETGRSPASG
ncbi:hypothetical protein ACF06X_21535 [Streptomyces sp. NPDC015346]|uniref:hypothetical protein n=1 Tax=Streptomyces sp. NPDC015346 TaxID=3364954 RepID=UPI0036F774E7